MEAVAGFPRYDQYKDSGVEWIGEIPAHWAVKRNKQLFREKKETVGKNAADYTLLSLTLKGVIARDMENPQGKFPAEFDSYKVVSNRDLIFCLFDIEETPRTVGMAHQGGMITGAYTVLECAPDVSERYLSYLYLSLDNGKHLKPLYTGLRKVIQRDTFMAVKTPIPPKKEQDRIANFLDQKTAEIDAAIAKKQRLIELLKEQKAILINQAVTQGLDPNVPKRDSGVEWIGQVPEHWEVFKLKYLVNFFSGGTPSKENPSFWNGTIPWISPKDMKKKFLESSIDTISRKAVERTTIKLLEPECVLIVVRGMILAKKVPVAINRVEATINQDMKAMVTNHLCLPEFLLHLLDGLHQQLSLLLEESGHGTKTLPSDALGNLKLPIPPVSVQEEIIKRIKAIDTQFDEAGGSIVEHIERLNEYKQTLISEAVTGKIKL